MKRALLVALALLGACAPSRVRLHLEVAPDASEAGSGPTLVTVYTAHGKALDGVRVDGALPGDVVILVDENAGEARVLARVAIDATHSALGVASGRIDSGKETSMGILLSTVPLDDADKDMIPDVIDDCPAIADPDQAGCEGLDASVPCGNGLADPDEACDDGADNSDDPEIAARCTTACKLRAPCGVMTGAAKALVDPQTGHCYVAWSAPINFTSAERACLDHGSHLASITSQAEDELVRQVAVDATSWIGVVQVQNNGSVEWTTTEKSPFTAFHMGEPSLGSRSCVVLLALGGGWEDRPCGWPQAGLLPVSPASTAAYVCEHTCGDGAIDSGEDCDPPGTACTNTCRKIASCTGGMTSPATGACYFRSSSVGNYNSVQSACPSGTHVGTPNGPIETETALKVIDADTWIAVRARNNPGDFDFDVNGWSLDPARYHGFASPDPDSTIAPACTVLSHADVRGDSWRDRGCSSFAPALCQRD